MITVYEAWDELQENCTTFVNKEDIEQIIKDVVHTKFATISSYGYLGNGKTYKKGTMDIRPYARDMKDLMVKEEEFWEDQAELSANKSEYSQEEVDKFYTRFDKEVNRIEKALNLGLNSLA